MTIQGELRSSEALAGIAKGGGVQQAQASLPPGLEKWRKHESAGAHV